MKNIKVILAISAFIFYTNMLNAYAYNSYEVIFYSKDDIYWELVYKNKILLFMYKQAYKEAKKIIDEARKNNLQLTIISNIVTSIENKHDIKNYIKKTDQTNKGQKYIYVAADNIKFENGFLWFKPKLKYQDCGKNKWITLKLPKHPKTEFIKSIIINNQKKQKILAINLTSLLNDFIFHYIHPKHIISELNISNITSSCEGYYN